MSIQKCVSSIGFGYRNNMKVIVTTIVFLLFSITSIAAVNIKRLNNASWVEISSDNFILTTDASEKSAKAMVEELERFRYFMVLLLGFEQEALKEKVPMLVANRSSIFRAFGFDYTIGGLFIRSKNGVNLFANAKGFFSGFRGGVNVGRQIVLHELVHHIVYNSKSNFAIPPWYSEGIAEYFGTYVERKKRIVLGDLSAIESRFYALIKPMGGFSSVDTESLFKMKKLKIGRELDDDDEEELNSFYARSLAVVHYLNADPDRRKQLYEYLRLIGEGYSIEGTFDFVFDMTFSDFDKAVDHYIDGRFVVARVFDKHSISFPEVHYTVAPLDKPTALKSVVNQLARVGGNLLSKSDRTKMFEDAQALYPNFIGSPSAMVD